MKLLEWWFDRRRRFGHLRRMRSGFAVKDLSIGQTAHILLAFSLGR